MQKRIKVLMVVPNLRVSNGVASFAMNYYRTLDHDRVKMDFVVYWDIESPYVKEIRENGDEVFVLPPLRHLPQHVAKCAQILRAGHYDVLHDNSLLITYPLMKLAQRSVKVRILHSHSSRLGETAKHEKRNRLFLGLLLRVANFYTACSSQAGKAMFGNRKVTIIPNIVNAEKMRYDPEIRASVRLEEHCGNHKIVGTVGRMTNAKNPFFALRVMDRVLKAGEDVEYWWIGNGALDKEVAETVSRMDTRDRVRLFGSREDIERLYQAMDLFFLPSKHEGFAMACLEAQASGLPCVVSDALPKQVNITGNVEFVPLASGEEQWEAIILRQLEKNENQRMDAYQRVRDSDYSSVNAGSALEREYHKMLEEVGAE